ncbi:unnamed protein product [Polarella glacialis]|uniref:Prolyl 4-hydroxylase alpha subunit domain-containing protein n=1 Tax=Polarella glacialis TaxID=89957 RepID=A0A813HN10_POLGL|nr:unnamed protein product [Polarella glacialis]CAE8677190.1 unnamed protein product [Polarella glacialis]
MRPSLARCRSHFCALGSIALFSLLRSRSVSMTGAMTVPRPGRRWNSGRVGGVASDGIPEGVGSSGPSAQPHFDRAAAVAGREAAKIETLNGAHKFLSNFHWSQVTFESQRYPSMEHAFQAAKLRTNSARRKAGFCDEGLSFGDAKRLGRRVPLREDWKDIREEVMADCLASKFSDAALRKRLLATGEQDIIDGHWGSPDLIWGYHYPSQAGENRLGIMLMHLRARLRSNDEADTKRQRQAPAAGSQVGQSVAPVSAVLSSAASGELASNLDLEAALFHLDWPVKCLHDGLPEAYATRIETFARESDISGRLVILPRRKICIALKGSGAGIDEWERRIRTGHVDVNSKGRPCKERMLIQLVRSSAQKMTSPGILGSFRLQVETWADLVEAIGDGTGLPKELVSSSLGPETPELPKDIKYGPGRTAVFLDGRRFPLCLNDEDASVSTELLLGDPSQQESCGPGSPVPLSNQGRPGLFGGLFARSVNSALSSEECQHLIKLAEEQGFGLAGSRGFNPFARYAMRCLVDAKFFAQALTARLVDVLPSEYPPGSGRQMIGLNERCRFLKYLPGMHHAGDHTDCAYDDPSSGRSFLTVQLYLNDDFCGGHLTFISDQLVPIKPALGRAIIFDHGLYHRGGMVAQGVKYALRMDVLYGPPGPNAAADRHWKGSGKGGRGGRGGGGGGTSAKGSGYGRGGGGSGGGDDGGGGRTSRWQRTT